MNTIKKDYTTRKQRDKIIADMNEQGYRLIEEQLYFDGRHLIFTEEPYIEPKLPRNLETEFDQLKAELRAKGIISVEEGV